MAFDKQLNEADKEVKELSDNWFEFGKYKVTVGSVELGETDQGKGYVELAVLGEKGEEDTARVWFTSEKSTNYAFNILRGIYVHNAPESKKEAAKSTMAAVKSVGELVEKMQQTVGGECWFTKYADPTRTYTANDGTVRQSVNKNVYGYEPQERQQADSAITDAFPGAAPADKATTAEIPKSW